MKNTKVCERFAAIFVLPINTRKATVTTNKYDGAMTSCTTYIYEIVK